MSNVISNKDSCLCLNTDALNNLKNDTKSDEESIKSHSKKFDFNPKERSLKGLVNLKQSFRTLSVPKRVVEKDKNEPSRFLGDGVTFKAKLIGILEVEEARGDRMCQEALFELKMAVRAAGEHKQRINIVIAIDGIRLRDEKTGDCLYHHPVHKISFIAQDVADSRAFGYIFGSPDTGHRFFGIKTDKAASQVVMAMRDLFQAVYELKKREVEMAKQNIEQHQLKYGSSFFLDSISASSSKSGSDPVGRTKSVVTREDSNKSVKNKTQTAGVIADLMDLELELNSLQQGLSQMERLTPSDPFGPSPSLQKEDPFGDSFTPPPCITTPPPAKLPPPPASGDRRKVGSTSSAASQPELHWFDKETQDLFSSEKNLPAASVESADKEKKEETRPFERAEISSKDLYDVFTELDPLGTGRSKPYMDKKDFFQELKNPPKKLLKDLVGNEQNADGTNFTTCFAGNTKSMFSEDSEKLYEDRFRKYNSVDSEHRVTLSDDASKPDSFYDPANDPFETSFANFAAFDGRSVGADESHRRSPHVIRNRSPLTSQNEGNSQSYLKSASTKCVYKPMLSSFSDDSALTAHKGQWSKPAEDNSRQKIVINLRKVLSNADDTDKENDSPVMEDATVLKNLDARSPAQGDLSSDSFESIPEPPPRPITSPIVSQPPPLPPKKLQLPVTMKPPPRPSSDTLSHYDYIENYESLGSRQKLNGDVQIPPLPAPARKPKFGQDVDRDFVRHRPHKQSSSSEPEYYLTPISKTHADKEERRGKVKPSLNITLSQLTSTGFEDLAAMLRIPASTLSKMTLKELTECLSRLSDAECQKLESDMCQKNRRQQIDNGKTNNRKSVDPHASTFHANFEDKFPPRSAPPIAQVDKYAVFRELIEQEEKKQVDKPLVEDVPETPTEPEVEPESEPSTEPKRKSSDERNDDKYAALRVIPAKTDDNVKESSEKEDSATEVILQAEDSEPTEPSIFTRKDSGEKNLSHDTKTEQESPDVVAESSPKPEDKEIDDKDDAKVSSESELGKNWAKFDCDQESKNSAKTTSPWQEEGKPEFAFKESKSVEEPKPIRYKKHRTSRKRWNDDEDEDDDDGNDEDYGDDSEENWESSKKSLGSSWDESSWRENGWSDRDSLYDDAEASPTASYRERRYQLKKKGYHRKFSPHKKSDEHSPWEEEAEWQLRKPYKEYVKEGDRIYDERKVRTPPWAGDRKRYEQKEEDELMLLKMMLGKKSLKALEEQLFKRYQDQLSEPAKKSYYNYLKATSKPPCDNDYVDGSGNKPRYGAKKYYTQRPKSADKGRKPLQIRPEDAEELFLKKYRRPYSHDELSISEEERWAHKSPTYKKPQRSRNQSQTSPFEDNFSPVPYDYADAAAESSHSKKSSRYPSATGKKTDPKRPVELHPYTAYDFKSGRSSRESSQRQSPFEDDFTPPDTQKCSERGSDVSKDSGDRRNDDEVFFNAAPSDPRNIRVTNRTSRMSRFEHAKRMDRPSKHYENVELRKKTVAESYYDKLPPKDKYKYSSKESNGDTGSDLKSPKKIKHPVDARRHDPFNDNVQSYESKTMPRLPKPTKSKNKTANYDSGSDSAEAAVKWKDDLASFTFSEQHGRK